MTNEKFMAFAKDKFDRQLQILGTKGAEYSKGKDDRFLNFKMAAAIQGISTKKALLGQLSKHLASVIDMINSDDDSISMEVWDEKIGDLINYLVLLEAIASEERTEFVKKLSKEMDEYCKNDPTPPTPFPISAEHITIHRPCNPIESESHSNRVDNLFAILDAKRVAEENDD